MTFPAAFYTDTHPESPAYHNQAEIPYGQALLHAGARRNQANSRYQFTNRLDSGDLCTQLAESLSFGSVLSISEPTGEQGAPNVEHSKHGRVR